MVNGGNVRIDGKMIELTKIFKKEPFFMGDSNRDQLVKICQVLGTDGLFKYLKKYNVKLDDDFYKILGK